VARTFLAPTTVKVHGEYFDRWQRVPLERDVRDECFLTPTFDKLPICIRRMFS
jgi:hypothetical protein